MHQQGVWSSIYMPLSSRTGRRTRGRPSLSKKSPNTYRWQEALAPAVLARSGLLGCSYPPCRLVGL
eukprot:170421-Chlamydomonas_euryale.AAC.2